MEPFVSVPTAAKPLLIESTHDSTHVYATDGANMYDISVTTAEAPCPPPNPVQSLATTSYGASVTPKQLLVKQDGTATYLLNNSPQDFSRAEAISHPVATWPDTVADGWRSLHARRSRRDGRGIGGAGQSASGLRFWGGLTQTIL